MFWSAFKITDTSWASLTSSLLLDYRVKQYVLLHTYNELLLLLENLQQAFSSFGRVRVEFPKSTDTQKRSRNPQRSRVQHDENPHCHGTEHIYYLATVFYFFLFFFVMQTYTICRICIRYIWECQECKVNVGFLWKRPQVYYRRGILLQGVKQTDEEQRGEPRFGLYSPQVLFCRHFLIGHCILMSMIAGSSYTLDCQW